MIRTEVTLSAAHMVHTDEESKCYRMHGHNWKVILELDGKIQEDGMIVDFNDIKEYLNQMDHNVWIPTPRKHCEKLTEYFKMFDKYGDCIQLPVPVITCEVVVKFLLQQFKKRWPHLTYVKITLYESEKSYAMAKWDVMELIK